MAKLEQPHTFLDGHFIVAPDKEGLQTARAILLDLVDRERRQLANAERDDEYPQAELDEMALVVTVYETALSKIDDALEAATRLALGWSGDPKEQLVIDDTIPF